MGRSHDVKSKTQGVDESGVLSGGEITRGQRWERRDVVGHRCQIIPVGKVTVCHPGRERIPGTDLGPGQIPQIYSNRQPGCLYYDKSIDMKGST